MQEARSAAGYSPAGVALHTLRARGITVALDTGLGQVARFEVAHGDRVIAPFARVPWADGPDADRFAPDTPPHLRRMSIDFFCAPFCDDDVEGAPPHGWTANAAWHHVEDAHHPNGTTARFRLIRKVAGAVVEKLWTVLDDHPFLYQEHRFVGGTGRLPVAHHVLIDLRQGGRLRFSPKLWAETPLSPLEPERSALSYGARGEDLSRFPGPSGPVDLTRYPIGTRHEDFAMLIDDPAQELGWASVLRTGQRDAAFLIKPVAVLPQTMLWFSNGGRDSAPWNGEHVGVLGIEDACALGIEGRMASCRPNRLTEQGIATSVDLGSAPVVSIVTAMGAHSCDAVKASALDIRDDHIRLDDGGATLPFWRGHFAPRDA